MPRNRLLTISLALLLVAAPMSAYTVYLKDGAKLIAKEAPEIRGNTAIIMLQNGTQSSIDASEIDLDRTRRANQHELGSALILEGGEFTEQPTAAEPEKERRLSDLGKNRSAPARPRTTRETRPRRSQQSPAVDLLDVQRRPFRNLDVASEIQGIFRGQGVGQTRLFQGTTDRRVLIDLTTDSEAAVFRGIKVAATALVHLQTEFPDTVAAFELVLSTSNRDRAGQFLLDAEGASSLADGRVEASAFYVDNVRF